MTSYGITKTQECQGIAGEVYRRSRLSEVSQRLHQTKFDGVANAAQAKLRSTTQRRENLEAIGVIRPFDDFALEVRKRFGQSILKDRPSISAIGEQGRKQDASVAILDVGGMNNRVEQRRPNRCMCRLLPCVCINSFEACSIFTRATACRIARPPKATFATRLGPGQLPSRTARHPVSSTTVRMESSSIGARRL